jgi:hypothetical protein
MVPKVFADDTTSRLAKDVTNKKEYAKTVFHGRVKRTRSCGEYEKFTEMAHGYL